NKGTSLENPAQGDRRADSIHLPQAAGTMNTMKRPPSMRPEAGTSAADLVETPAMPISAAITGWGIYSPTKVLRNADLERLVDTSDEWILSRTGIRERRVAGPEDTTSSMCTAASKQALDKAGLTGADIEFILCGTTTPDYLLPSTACIIQERLGATNAGA